MEGLSPVHPLMYGLVFEPNESVEVCECGNVFEEGGLLERRLIRVDGLGNMVLVRRFVRLDGSKRSAFGQHCDTVEKCAGWKSRE